ncbi:lipoprotein insertase outer membrane protein LolB [Acidovorax sp.]|jgi:outer membrane lipoprotein LolB|uniref:lipoprotein insertase outer membrane protein LolB n=1 Tax=Acidovorax sp. TaxID=1872122 RepID=UPI00391F0D9A
MRGTGSTATGQGDGLPLCQWMAWLALACTLWLTGCAQPPRAPEAGAASWSGRLSLQVEGQASQSFSSLFDLQGNPGKGELVLTSPLGNTLARLQWEDGRAQLTTGQERRESTSLDELLREATGTAIPVAAIFEWLNGNQASATGWQADLSGSAEGRLIARRHDPAPEATLRIAFSR